jgi:hypothetical protein
MFVRRASRLARIAMIGSLAMLATTMNGATAQAVGCSSSGN